MRKLTVLIHDQEVIDCG